jgi:hypothetical protein
MKRILKIIFVLLGLSSLAFIIFQETVCLDTPGKIFSKKFEADVDFMLQNGHLPKVWNSIREVKFVATSKSAATWLAESKPTIAIIKDGKYILEYVLIDDSEPEKQDTIALVQMSLIEVDSGNKIWELARIYSLDDD